MKIKKENAPKGAYHNNDYIKFRDVVKKTSINNTATRAGLKYRFRVDDRKIRAWIEQMRREGYHVRCCEGRVYIAKSKKDKSLLEREYISRIQSLATTLAALRGVPLDGQEEIQWKN